ncbi:MAG: CBS domain-containing protein [Nitratireductor sp.]|nr:CBS domain-containing protein [Nitratireductor sp.]
MKASTDATPLFALQAAALDTETTGLDPADARIVQLGAVHMSGKVLLAQSAWEQIVNPDIAVPAESTAIHGISQEMADASPRLKEVWPTFMKTIEGRVVIGHSIGFDLAVLAAEAKRNRLPFSPPRSLCIRMLAQIVAPSLANHSLDALASWLGVEIHGRHSALGDAEAAGAVFLALVPRLEAAGLKTLAELERACQRLTPEIERQEEAGWVAPVNGVAKSRMAASIARLDTYPYRHTIGEIMSGPVSVVTPDTTLKTAMDRMAAQGISSVFVSKAGKADEDISAYAILTERDVMRKISAMGAAALDLPVGDIASAPIRTIREGAFVYRAVGRMARLKYRHLGVRSQNNRLIGIVSARDLLKLRSDPAIALDDAIEEARSAPDLAVAWASLPGVVSSLVGEEVDASIVCRIVSEEIRAMTRRAAALAEQSMIDEGLGGPPSPYCVMVLGSGGRGESMLVPDQDNAIVFAEGEPGGDADRWFAELGSRLSATLDEAGIPLCKGGVMAKNPLWRGSLETWTARIDEWVRRSRPEDLLNVDIFFDAMPVGGELSLGDELFNRAYERGHQSVAFAKLLGESLASVPNPFTMFGGLKNSGNRLDLKMHALFPVAALARTLAIRHNIAMRSTRERIEALVAHGIGPEAQLGDVNDAHALCMGMVLECQGRDIAAGLKATNLVDLSILSRSQKNDLGAALRAVQEVPALVRDLMFAH